MNDDEESILCEIRKLAITKQLNFLIGSGASMPAAPLMSEFEGNDKNEQLSKKICEISNALINPQNKTTLDPDMTKKIDVKLEEYIEFIQTILNILNISNSRQTPKNANIFTTNYDLFIEKAVDKLSISNRFVFNDGANGYFNRILDSSNYNKIVSYKGLNDNYISEIPSLTLIKPHGSVNWEKAKDSDNIFIKTEVVDKPVLVHPTGYESQETFINNHFHEMLRVFQLELDKPQSVLFVLGFSFQDKHIAKMVTRALKNPELIVYAFGYKDDDRKQFLKNLSLEKKLSNLEIITPKNLSDISESITLSEVTKILAGNFEK